MKKSYKENLKILSILIILSIPIFISFSIIFKVGNDAKDVFAEVYDVNDIIPKPRSYIKGEGSFNLTKDTGIYVKGKTEEESKELIKIANFFLSKIKPSTGYDLKVVSGKDDIPVGSILLSTLEVKEDEELDEEELEGYKLVSDKDKVIISAHTPQGIFNGIQTLLQMLPSDIAKNSLVSGVNWNMPAATINDKPEYGYRGLMIDVARHFFTPDEIKRQIDLASQYKINRVHLHLSDDQGWRLEIKKYPDLTSIGGSTEVGGGPGGYYTQEQFKDIVAYAKDRYIEIVPEFDMPGHTNAALASYGFLNPDGKRKPLYTGTNVGFSTLMTDSEKTYEFIDDVFKEVSAISPSKYLHIGGDEADSTKKSDYDYFVGRVSKIAEKYGKTPIGWDPIDTSPEINSSVILQNWKDSNEAAVNKKMNIITSIASKAYLDMKYNKETPYGLDWAGYIPIETAYKWDPTDYAPRELSLGLESPLWTETISNKKEMDYMIYPRLLGYAEIGWTPKEIRNWDEYKIRLEKQGERLTNEGVNYYRDNSIWK